jgi:hypothetical protein
MSYLTGLYHFVMSSKNRCVAGDMALLKKFFNNPSYDIVYSNLNTLGTRNYSWSIRSYTLNPEMPKNNEFLNIVLELDNLYY